MICFGTNAILFASGRALGNAKNVGVRPPVADKFGHNKIVSDIVGADLCRMMGGVASIKAAKNQRKMAPESGVNNKVFGNFERQSF